MAQVDVVDIIKQAFENSPSGVESAFNSAIQQKMSDAINSKREEIGQENNYDDQTSDWEND